MDVPSISLSSQKNSKSRKKVFSDRGEWDTRAPQESRRVIEYLASELNRKKNGTNKDSLETIKKFFDIHKSHFLNNFSYSDNHIVYMIKNSFFYLKIKNLYIYNYLIKILNKLFNRNIEIVEYWQNKFSNNLTSHQLDDLNKVRDLLCEYPYGIKDLKQ